MCGLFENTFKYLDKGVKLGAFLHKGEISLFSLKKTFADEYAI